MNVLVYCPTYRLEPETVERIMALQWPHGDVDVVFGRQHDMSDDRAALVRRYNYARALVLRYGYDYLCTIESDILPPPDALTKMHEADSDVATGVYALRRGKAAGFVNVKSYEPTSRFPLKSLSHWPEQLWGLWGTVIDCTGEGLGCCLIRAGVLEGIKFRDAGKLHCDFTFACDVLKARHTYRAHLGVVCGHKRPDGVVLWPRYDGSYHAMGAHTNYDLPGVVRA